MFNTHINRLSFKTGHPILPGIPRTKHIKPINSLCSFQSHTDCIHGTGFDQLEMPYVIAYSHTFLYPSFCYNYFRTAKDTPYIGPAANFGCWFLYEVTHCWFTTHRYSQGLQLHLFDKWNWIPDGAMLYLQTLRFPACNRQVKLKVPEATPFSPLCLVVCPESP